MHEIAADGAPMDKSGRVAIAVALLSCMLVAAGIASVDAASAQQLRGSRQAATEVPPSGTLRGYSAVSHTEWTASTEKGNHTVLFGISPTGESGDMEYWVDIASRSRAVVPGIEFVGLCIADSSCSPQPRAVRELTLLSSMDPLQLRAVAIATKKGSILVYRAGNGVNAQGLLPIQKDRSALVSQIVRLSREQIKEAGDE